MSVDTILIAQLRKTTGAGMMDCKKALFETDGDMEKAVDYLRKHGIQKACKKSERQASEGIVAHYIHANRKIGALVELRCETDFVARNQDFLDFGHDIAMHTVAASPLYLSREDVPADVLDKEKELYREQLSSQGKPEDIIEKIIVGKINKYYEEVCLLDQKFIKDDSITIAELINEKISKIGEKIEITRFSRLEI